MDRDYAYRYSDENYLSKDEVKKTMNLTNIDHIWDTIIEYRKLYFKVLDVFSNERKPFSICLNNGLINRVINLEKKLMRLEILNLKYSNLDEIKYKNILQIMCDFNNFDETSDAVIEGIINSSLVNYPRQYNIINNYFLCLKDIDACFASPINEVTLKRIYSILIHGRINQIDNLDSVYRTTDLSSSYDPYASFRHYEGAPSDKIPLIMDTLFDYMNNSKGFKLIDGAILFFNIIYFKPFECFNEEMAILLTKYYFSHEEEKLTLFSLEKFINHLNDLDIKKTILECEANLDLTYFVHKFLDLIEELISDENKLLQHQEELLIQKEVLVDDNNVETSEEIVQEERKILQPVQTVNRYEGLTFERKISMPVLPKGLDEEDASIVASNLLELCPTLKKGQAEFYARHCTIGKYYTIQQYKDERSVAYETARTSMDNLAELGFYKKEKIRNKFVYTPVIRS